MGKHIRDELHRSEFIMWSDPDQPKVMDLFAGFNVRNEMVVTCDYTDYEATEYNCATAAVVDKDDVEKMARRHNVKYSEVPYFISQNMDEWREIVNPSIFEVMDCFKDIMERLVEEGCRYRIIRKYGKDDFFWF